MSTREKIQIVFSKKEGHIYVISKSNEVTGNNVYIGRRKERD